MERIHFVGNLMIDALEITRPLWSGSDVLGRLGLEPDRPFGSC